MRWAGAGLAALGLWLGCAVGLDQYGRGLQVVEPADVIVVAGCRVLPDGRASPCLRGRVEGAVALWRAGIAERLLMTGGRGTYGPSEAVAARAYALALGVPQEVVMLEERSTSTWENAFFASTMLDAEAVVVVTDTYHLFRARQVFQKHFEHVQGSAVEAPLGVRATGACREVAAVFWYWLRGHFVISFRG